MHGRLAIALLGIAVLVPLSPAQQLRGPLFNIPAPTTGGPSSLASRSFSPGLGPMRHFHRSGVASPYFYSDFPYSTYVGDAEIAGPPQIVVVQSPPAQVVPEEPRPEPLLIELQGDRYVRVANVNGKDHSDRATPYRRESTLVISEAKPENAAPALLPVILVYRDGRQEEVRDYTITGGFIYARGDYWTDGYWNKKIQLLALNLPATIKASHEHGVKFVLPSSPNEVIVRP